MLESVSLFFQFCCARLLVCDVSVQKQCISEPVIKPAPVEPWIIGSQSRKPIVEQGVVIVIAQKEVNLAITGALQKFLKPADRGICSCFRSPVPRPPEVENVSSQNAAV